MHEGFAICALDLLVDEAGSTHACGHLSQEVASYSVLLVDLDASIDILLQDPLVHLRSGEKHQSLSREEGRRTESARRYVVLVSHSL